MKTLSQPSQSKLNELRNNLVLVYPKAKEEDNQGLIDYLILKVWEDIQIYCHLTEFPEDLENTLVEMVLSNLLTYRWLDSREEIDQGRIKTVTEGDITVTRLTEEEASKITSTTKGMSVSYYYKLNAYRRVQS